MLHFTWQISVSLPTCMLTVSLDSLLSSSVLASSVILLTWLCVCLTVCQSDSSASTSLLVYPPVRHLIGCAFHPFLQKDCGAVDALPSSIQLQCVGFHKPTWERKSVSCSMQPTPTHSLHYSINPLTLLSGTHSLRHLHICVPGAWVEGWDPAVFGDSSAGCAVCQDTQPTWL